MCVPIPLPHIAKHCMCCPAMQAEDIQAKPSTVTKTQTKASDLYMRARRETEVYLFLSIFSPGPRGNSSTIT